MREHGPAVVAAARAIVKNPKHRASVRADTLELLAHYDAGATASFATACLEDPEDSVKQAAKKAASPPP